MSLETEKFKDYIFPKLYKEFYLQCGNEYPKQFVGSDLINFYPNLKDFAIELLGECSIENFLKERDFVFLMHQGYMFWFFEANGIEDPDVYFYFEGDTKPKNICKLEHFLSNYPKI